VFKFAAWFIGLALSVVDSHQLTAVYENNDFQLTGVTVSKNGRCLSTSPRAALRNRCHEFASDGRYELFKTTMKYDGDIGRQQHGFKSAPELRL
jgi:hypothetical protein